MSVTIPAVIPKIKELSYSSCLDLHGCPRKYQLNKLMRKEDMGDTRSVTFAFGHAVGEGIQSTLLGKSREEVLWDMFLIWDFDLLGEEPKAKKSFAEAVLAVEKFHEYLDLSDLKNYEVAVINGKYATELSFKIVLIDGYVYRGFIDVVLKHKETAKLLVLELKTTGGYKIDEAQYKNSAQALGYTLVLDTLNETKSPTFEVRYLVYKTKSREYEALNFVKIFSHKVDWVRSIIMDCEALTKYRQEEYFPRYGESCYNYFRQCQHFQYCTLKDTSLQLNQEAESTDTVEYTVELNLLDIIGSMEESAVSRVVIND